MIVCASNYISGNLHIKQVKRYSSSLLRKPSTSPSPQPSATFYLFQGASGSAAALRVSAFPSGCHRSCSSLRHPHGSYLHASTSPACSGTGSSLAAARVLRACGSLRATGRPCLFCLRYALVFFSGCPCVVPPRYVLFVLK